MSQRSLTLKILEVASALFFVVFIWMVFFYAPLEASMGAVQRVFYFHVATAWVGMLGFIASGLMGIIYLIKHDLKWDIVEVAAVEISLVFFLITIILGSIWAYPAWNTWWTWEPRLTTAAVLELIYMAYLLLRQGIEETEKRARFGAIYAIVGGLSVPLTFMSIRLFRTIHPVVVGSANAVAKGGFDMTPRMLQTMFFSLIVFSLLFVVLFWHRIRLGQLAQKVEQLKLNFND